VSLFRIIPTAYLGVILATVVVLTGSILPAILWHTLNNALVLVPASLGWLDPDQAVAGWLYALAAVGLAASLWVIARYGRGYPGVTVPEVARPEASREVSRAAVREASAAR
jgi:hypothetical protein